MLNGFRVAVVCGIVGALLALPGCTQSEREQIFASVTGGDSGKMSSVGSILNSRNGDVASAIAALEAVRVLVRETRPAKPAEQAQAKQKASKELDQVSAEDRRGMREQGTYVAVAVDPAADAPPAPGTESIVLVNPETGEPADDTVYEVNAGSANSGDKINLGEYEAIYVD